MKATNCMRSQNRNEAVGKENIRKGKGKGMSKYLFAFRFGNFELKKSKK